ncbi:MAG: PilW family protein [Candidatus Dojkabacteria bacterium]|jgi:prepilin-type N-terminal cleavage/methylation domain-containing protein
MIRVYKRKTYEGFSLIEMLITTVLLGFIMLISALVLTTLLRVSTTATNKARIRTDSEYVLELLKRTIRTTSPDYVKIFDSSGREFDTINNNVSIRDGVFTEVTTGTGNEIHIKPNGSSRWLCVAYYKGSPSDTDNAGVVKGYILKTSIEDMDNNIEGHKGCFNPEVNHQSNYLVLNSRFANIEDFKIKQSLAGDDYNKIIQFDLKSSAVYWYFAKGGLLNRSFYRQAVVKTEGVIW